MNMTPSELKMISTKTTPTHRDIAGKVHKLMDYTTRGGDVADPWYSERFDVAYRDIFDGCTALLDAILKQDKQ